MENSNKTKKKRKARKSKTAFKKPYPYFPLTPRSDGRWCKRIAGRIHYFGKIADDPSGTAAIEQLNRELPFLINGDDPPDDSNSESCTIAVLCNHFLTSKLRKLKSGELAHATFADYQRSTDLLIKNFGKHKRVDSLSPTDFEVVRSKLAEQVNLTSLSKFISMTRIILKFAFDQRLIDRPVHYGQSFDKPRKKDLTRLRREAGENLFTSEEVLRILETADPIMRAMILLGINCGFGNHDCASLPQSAIDFENGWVVFPRVKTGIERRIPLWPETIEALLEAIRIRPKPKDPGNRDCVFITKFGNRWVRVEKKKNPKPGEEEKYAPSNSVTIRFRSILNELEINHRRRLGFYTLRHTFRTVADECRDQPPVNAIMGHTDNSMADVYRERISDERLKAVTDTVYRWLWPEPEIASNPVSDTANQSTSLRSPAIIVEIEFDSGAGKRKSKRFEDMHKAKRFYCVKDVEGKNPKVRAEVE